MDLFEVSKEIAARLQRIFCRDDKGRRPVYGGTEKFQNDPNWRDDILSTSTFTATMARASGPATRPDGPE